MPLQILPFESSLLIVELVLLVFTLILVLFSFREAKGRGFLLEQMVETAQMVSRQEYFTTVVEAVQGASTYVWGSITGSTPGDAELVTIQTILEQVEAACSRGVDVRYLLPATPDRLHMASR